MVLTPGTDVSAKYRGAWCEGTIKSVARALSIKVNRGLFVLATRARAASHALLLQVQYVGDQTTAMLKSSEIIGTVRLNVRSEKKLFERKR